MWLIILHDQQKKRVLEQLSFHFLMMHMYYKNKKLIKHLSHSSHSLSFSLQEHTRLFSLCGRIPVLRLQVKFSWPCMFVSWRNRDDNGITVPPLCSTLRWVGVSVFSHDFTVFKGCCTVLKDCPYLNNKLHHRGKFVCTPRLYIACGWCECIVYLWKIYDAGMKLNEELATINCGGILCDLMGFHC